MKKGSVRLFTIVLAAALGLTLPARAQTDTPPGWRVSFQAVGLDLDTSFRGSGPHASEISFGGGVGVNAEYRFSRRLGLDLGFLAGGGTNITVGAVGHGPAAWYSQDSFGFTPVTAGLDVHLPTGKTVDLYFAPLVAVIHYGNLFVRVGNTSVITGVAIDTDIAAGATLGLGVTFARQRWSFESRLTYLDSRLRGESPPDIRVDTDCNLILFGIGFGYRFGPRS